jgi:hypothetical protein
VPSFDKVPSVREARQAIESLCSRPCLQLAARVVFTPSHVERQQVSGIEGQLISHDTIFGLFAVALRRGIFSVIICSHCATRLSGLFTAVALAKKSHL